VVLGAWSALGPVVRPLSRVGWSPLAAPGLGPWTKDQGRTKDKARTKYKVPSTKDYLEA
jgi:hypothetical protein